MCYKTDKYFYIIYITLQVSSENLRLARVTKLPLELSNNSARVFNILVDILDASSLQVEILPAQPYLQLISSNGHLIKQWGGGRSEIHKYLFMKNDQLSPELLLLIFRKHLKGDNYQSRLSLCSRLKRLLQRI